MKIKKVTVGSFFQENASVVLIQTPSSTFRIIAEGDGVKIRILADDGNDNLSVRPKAANMVILEQAK